VTTGRDTGLVPWCNTCDRFLSPPTVREDGTCPTCGRPVQEGSAHAAPATSEEAAKERRTPLPWHLKLLAGALAIYLGFRAWQGIEWIIHRL
jgi:hypothetical protein